MAEMSTPDPSSAEERLSRAHTSLHGVQPGDHAISLHQFGGLLRASLSIGTPAERHAEPVILHFDAPSDLVAWLEAAHRDLSARLAHSLEPLSSGAPS